MEIIDEDVMDERNDIWRPMFDSNATKLNPSLDGACIKMPGFIIPIDLTAAGVSGFVFMLYVGACLHPPPPNQLVLLNAIAPWPSDDL